MFAPKASETRQVILEVVRSYAYVLLWMAVSISVILFNKWLLAYSGFPFPIALTIWHMAFCTFVGVLVVRVLKLIKSHNMSAAEYMKRVMPIGLLYAGSLWLSNSAYLYLSVSFIQMTKSLMPGLVYLSGIVLGAEKYNLGVTLNMILIAFGVLICAVGELNLVVKGLIQQLAALQFEALRLTMVQILINSKGLGMSPFQSLYYVSPACFVCLAIPFLLVDFPEMLHRTDWVFNAGVMVANALTALLLNLALFLLIGKTSALTMNIAGVIKDWMLIFSSFYLFKAPLTSLNLLGYGFCCSGVVIYQRQKLQQLKNKARISTESKDEEKTANIQVIHPRQQSQPKTKEEYLSTIMKLQAEMNMLDNRVQHSSKVMNEGGHDGRGPTGSNPSVHLHSK